MSDVSETDVAAAAAPDVTDLPAAPTGPDPDPGAARVLALAGPDADGPAVDAATAAVRAGQCIVLPTDTVYGIGADAFSADAVQRLLDAKGRGRDMPPPVLIGDPSVLMALGRDIPDAAKKLAEEFWPGALTLIVPAQVSLRMDLGDTQGTVAVRVPDHEATRALLRATGPLAVSSANRTGRPAATDVTAAQDQLGDLVAVYLDGGPTRGQVPSTIVDFTRTDYGVVVRSGLIPTADLRTVVPYLEEHLPEASDPDHSTTPEPANPAPAPTEREQAG